MPRGPRAALTLSWFSTLQYARTTPIQVLALGFPESPELGLLGCARVWRAVRLVNAMVGVTQAEREKVEAQLGQTRVALAEMDVEKERAEQALRREVEANGGGDAQQQRAFFAGHGGGYPGPRQRGCWPAPPDPLILKPKRAMIL